MTAASGASLGDTSGDGGAGADMPVAAVVLAAGGSRRLGAPKQLVRHNGVPLVRRAAEAACAAGARPVVVVLGARARRVARALAGLPIVIAVNDAWATGVASSIRVGLSALAATADDGAPAARWTPADGAVLVALADQPLVDAGAFTRLLEAYRRGGRPLAAAEYGGTVGVPAVFGPAYVSRLATLPDGDRGAGPLLRAAASEALTRVPLTEAEFDVDTLDDVRRLASAHGASAHGAAPEGV